MTRLEIIESLAGKQAWLTFNDVEKAVKIILEHKSGETVFIPAKFIPRFKTGKELRERIARE